MSNSVLSKKEVFSYFQKRDENSNKGSFGRTLCICGSYGMAGAATICAKANILCGSGICDVALENSIYPIVSSSVHEAVFTPFDENTVLSELKTSLSKANCVAFGCGRKNNAKTNKILCFLSENCCIPIIIDADGINALSENIELIKSFNAPVILTPHPGEMSRLCKKSIAETQQNRDKTASEFSKEHGVITVLKGHNTVISDENGNVFINPTGNAGMACAGSGDMLCGMIASFVSQGFSPINACKAGVFIHGLCGDISAERFSMHSTTPSSMLSVLPSVFIDIEASLRI